MQGVQTEKAVVRKKQEISKSAENAKTARKRNNRNEKVNSVVNTYNKLALLHDSSICMMDDGDEEKQKLVKIFDPNFDLTFGM